MHYCMNKEELRQFLDYQANHHEVSSSEELRGWIDRAENWEGELGCLVYLFAEVLEKQAKLGENCQPLIEKLYQLPEQMYFSIQEFDSDFVEYLLRNTREPGLSLEEELVRLQNSLRERRYDKTLRY